MDDVIVTRHKYHIVRSLPGCTVRQEGANGTVIETTVPADEDTAVFAHSGRWTVEGDENVTVTEVFKPAPQQKLALLGVLGGNDGLPAGFKRVAYLESDGGQYIAIPEVEPSSQQKVTGIFYAPRQGIETKLLFGGRNTWQLSAIAMTVHTDAVQDGTVDSQMGFAQYGNEAIPFDSRSYLEKKINVSISLDGAFINGDKVAAFNTQTFSSTNYYCLFTIRSENKNDSRIFNGRCYVFNITQGGEYIINLIPCVNTNTGEPCMFDLVSKQEFKNNGTGQFIVGMTLSQVRGLRLPAGGGELTVSVPADTPDSAVEQLRQNNLTWQIAIQYRTDNEN